MNKNNKNGFKKYIKVEIENEINEKKLLEDKCEKMLNEIHNNPSILKKFSDEQLNLVEKYCYVSIEKLKKKLKKY